MPDTRFHSVRLEAERCKGCTSCLKHCPTEAIRVRGGRAHIIAERCVDCGECIRNCAYHAKIAMTDQFEDIFRFEHRIALPAPSFYGQFRHVDSIGVILDALLKIGFQEVFEVARGADIVTRAVRDKLRDYKGPRPLISSACPAVVRIIQVRFPSLIPHIMDIRQPMEVAAALARAEYAKAHDVAPQQVGVFFITPCAAKMTSIRSPIGHAKSEVDGAISMMEIYARLLPHLKKSAPAQRQSTATPHGVGWANSGGEIKAAVPKNSIAVDGIENVIGVLEEVENNKLRDLDFFEGAACRGGCVGGPLTYENSYLARNTIRTLKSQMPKAHPKETVDAGLLGKFRLEMDVPIEANASMQLDQNIAGALERMEAMNKILERLPGYDCGSCGSPTCQAFAEDIVRGYCMETDCIYLLKDCLKVMAQQMVDIAHTKRE